MLVIAPLWDLWVLAVATCPNLADDLRSTNATAKLKLSSAAEGHIFVMSPGAKVGGTLPADINHSPASLLAFEITNRSQPKSRMGFQNWLV